MKIAVIGSGVSGLTSAYYLSQIAEVYLFESQSYIGGHTNTIDVEVSSGKYAVDTGFIVFNDRTYPRFIRLMEKLKVPFQLSNMSFSVKDESSGLEYNGTDLNRLFIQRRNLLRPSFYRMIKDILRFNRESPLILEKSTLPEKFSLGQYLKENNYSSEFINQYIIPMGAAIWSSSSAQMQEFPVSYFVQFFKNHGMLSVNNRPLWRVIQHGSRSYVGPLTQPFKERIYLNSPVQSVKRNSLGVLIDIEQNGQRSQVQFDHVVMAGHSNQTLSLLSDASLEEREILGSFSYQENSTTLHTDISVLPTNQKAWASWNYLKPKNTQKKVAVTYNMNILQSLKSPETFLVSLNMDERIDADKILKKITYHHPVYSAQAVAAQNSWVRISGKNRTHFCGAYWGYGFHEDGVVSAERVCRSLGASVS